MRQVVTVAGVLIAFVGVLGCRGGSPDDGALHAASLTARAAASLYDDLGRSDLITLPTGRQRFHDAAAQALEAANAAHVGPVTEVAHGLSIDAASVTGRFSTAVDALFAAREELTMANDALKEARLRGAEVAANVRTGIEAARNRALSESSSQHEARLQEVRDAKSAAYSHAETEWEERVQTFFDEFYSASEDEQRGIDFDAALSQLKEEHEETLRSIDEAHGRKTTAIHRQRTAGAESAVEGVAASGRLEVAQAEVATRAILDDIDRLTIVAARRTREADRLRRDALAAYREAAAAWEAVTLKANP